jgi:hypothetical protein
MTQIRASIQKKSKFKRIDEEIYKFKNTNIAPEIESSHISENETEESSPNVSDDELSDNHNSNTTNNVQAWKNMVAKWIDMTNNDSDLENLESENENSIENSIDDDDDITLENISNFPHPATDKNAKWKLQDIFSENLDASSYLESFINNDN